MNTKLDPFQSASALFVEFALAGKLGSFDPTDLGRLQGAKADIAAAAAAATEPAPPPIEVNLNPQEKPADAVLQKNPAPTKNTPPQAVPDAAPKAQNVPPVPK